MNSFKAFYGMAPYILLVAAFLVICYILISVVHIISASV